jgi:argininosuccinate lyase
MKLWGGRFSGARDPFFEKFSESFSLDQRLIHYDLRVNRAYVTELSRARVLNSREVRALVRGLQAIERYVERHPRWAEREQCEDVHTWVEARLARFAGPVAHKLRTGRSRNDLIATEMRMYARDAIAELERAILAMLQALLEQAHRHPRVIFPGYTHLQPAQPILFAHYLLAYFEMLERDFGRLEDCRPRADELPLGSGALAGTAFPLDRNRLARELGFARASRNSLDATSDRDFVCELAFACALALAHLSRWSEDLIVYSTPAFGYIELADAYSTGSSLMPQKKNADALELIRGKTARVQGRLAGLLALLKGLPLAYDRDLQEDKPALFDAVDTTRDCLQLAARVMRTLRVNEDRMRRSTELGFLTATDVADELVRRGVPFAAAHEQVGKLVRRCLDHGKSFAEISDSEASLSIPLWDRNLRSAALSAEFSLERKRAVGGTAPRQVAMQIATCNRRVARLGRELSRRDRRK